VSERSGKVQSFGPLLPFFRHVRAPLAASLGVLLLATAAELAIPWLVGRVTDVVASGGSWQDVTRYSAWFLVAIGVRAVAEVSQGWAFQRAGQRLTRRLREAVFDRTLRLPVGYFDTHPSGKTATRILFDVRSIGDVFTASMATLLLDAFVILGTVVAMWWLDWRLAAVVLFSFPAVLFGIFWFGERLGRAYREARARLGEANAFLAETLPGALVIQQHAAQAERVERFRVLAERYEASQRDAIRTFSLLQPLANGINGLAVALLLGVGGFLVLQGSASIGTVVAFLGYVKNLYQPVRDLIEKYNVFLSARAAAERVSSILVEPTEPPSAPMGPVAVVRQEPLAVRARGLTFRYPSGVLALEDVSFDLRPGHTLALIGPTGSGKSSLAKLLVGFYQPTAGELAVGERPVETWEPLLLRQTVRLLPQENYLFAGTLRENLLLGESFDDAVLRDVLEASQLWPLCRDRGGLDLVIAENGANLSVGERQLVAISRVLLRPAPVLVFDEATASIDPESERRLQDALRVLLVRSTAVLIAHRPSTLRLCEQVLRLEKGRVVGAGEVDELLARPDSWLSRWCSTGE
jgi:ATP-binding cassette subfamily B protein